MLVNKLKTGFVVACICGIIYGMSIDNYYGTAWAAIALVTSYH